MYRMPTNSNKLSSKQVVVVHIHDKVKRKHRKKKKKTKSSGNVVSDQYAIQRITQNAAYTSPYSSLRPYIPAVSFIASPYNGGVVPDEYQLNMKNKIDKMNEQIRNIALTSYDNTFEPKTVINNDLYNEPHSPNWSDISSPTYPASPMGSASRGRGRPAGSKNTLTLYREQLAKGSSSKK